MTGVVTGVVTGRRGAVLGMMLGAAVVLVAQGRTWVQGRVAEGVNTGAEVSASGGSAAAGVVALALVVLAGAVVVASSGRRVARWSASLVSLAGAGVVVSAVGVWRDPAAALRDQVTAQAAVSSSAATASATAWVVLGIAGGVVTCLAGAAAVTRAGTWPERTPGPSRGVSVRADEPMWDALNRGEDPTGP